MEVLHDTVLLSSKACGVGIENQRFEETKAVQFLFCFVASVLLGQRVAHLFSPSMALVAA